MLKKIYFVFFAPLFFAIGHYTRNSTRVVFGKGVYKIRDCHVPTFFSSHIRQYSLISCRCNVTLPLTQGRGLTPALRFDVIIVIRPKWMDGWILPSSHREPVQSETDVLIPLSRRGVLHNSFLFIHHHITHP